MDWTKEQKQAITEKNSNILVAAAAGSGKTAVLVERIIQKIINDNIDIDKLLIVTFTNAAASEMRERILQAIYKKIEENPENIKLQRQVTLLNKANICTIDSFCLDVVKSYFYELENVSPNFRIGDTTEVELLKQETIEELFEEKYEKENKDFIKLISTYTSYKDDTPLKEIILKIYNYIQSNPFPEKWLAEKIEMFNLEEKANQDFSKTIWGEELLNEIEEEMIDDITILENLENSLSYESELVKFQQTIRNDLDMLQNLKNNLNNWDKAYEISSNISFVTWPRQKIESELKDEAKKIRDEVKKKLSKTLEKVLICNSKDANEDIQNMYYILKKLEYIILEFSNVFSKKKRERNIVDFNDIEHFALKILVKDVKSSDSINKLDIFQNLEITEIAKKYREKFDEIAIDEYQDSNLVQEYILNAVSNGKNIFMVGDVKQSIYKFRQAMPELFLSKYDTYSMLEDRISKENLKIKLFKNFRSRENVLKFTNLIFQDIMSNLLGDVEYNDDEYLNLGADYPNVNQNLKTEINIINLKDENEKYDEKLICNQIEDENQEESQITSQEERLENVELEARFVANKVKKLIENKYQIWDAKKEKYRNITYKDIVILLRSTSNIANVYEQELTNLEIPVFSDTSQEYLDSIEIQTIMSVLKIIDNPMQDIPLVTVLRSNIGKFTDNDLIEIRLVDKYDNFYVCMQKSKANVNAKLKEKINNFFDNIEKWRKEQEFLSLDELIWKIYIDTGYYNYAGLMPNGILRQANLKMLFQRAKQYESANFKGLYNFINFIEKLKLSSGDMGAAKLIGENDDVVRIMSIHKSKGLEFPVVFLSSTGKQFNLMDLNNNILLHQDLGIGAKYIDYDRQVQYDTLTKCAMKNKILKETLSEEMRILYVALTRAKEKLIITGLSKDFNSEIEKIEKQVEMYDKNLNKINPILVKKYKRYLDWILLVYNYEQNNIKELTDLYVYSIQEIKKFFENVEKEQIDIAKKLDEVKVPNNTIEKLEKDLNWKYLYNMSTKIPTKMSVTQIKQMKQVSKKDSENNKVINSNYNDNNQESIKESKFKIPEFLKTDEENKITGAQRGTLIHLCLQKLDHSKEYKLEDINELINSLILKKIITQKEAEAISTYKILAFTKSLIWKEMKNAKLVEKEKPFYINIPAKEIYCYDNDKNNILSEKVLVQGVIDLYYRNENGELVLVDYKTDYVQNENELVEKYKEQLAIYKKALQSALNEKDIKVYLYSIYLEKEILID